MSENIRIFVVDDEQPVLEGVRAVVKNQAEGFTVAGTALNGRHALEEIRSLQPDVILMDINMPGLSGIEVVRELRSQGIRTVCILVTAYERFDIAREAFGLGIFAYLLKPVTPANLLEVLEDARREVEQNRSRDAGYLETRSSLESLMARSERYFFSLLLSGGMDEDEILAGAGEMGISLDDSCTLVLLSHGGDKAGAFDDFLRQLGYSYGFKRSLERNNRVFLVIPGDPGSQRLAAVMKRIVEKNPERYVSLNLHHAMHTIESTKSLASAARALINRIPARLSSGRPSLNEAEADPSAQAADPGAHKSGRGAASPGLEQTNNVENLLLAGEAGKAFTALRLAEPGIFRRAPDLYDRALRMLSLLYAREDDEGIERWLAGVSLPNPEDTHAVEAWLRDELEALADHYQRKLETNPLIRQALLYVEGNYSRSIGLEDAADSCGVSPQHLSKTFSRVMGISFIDHLTQVRIQHAIELFRRGNRSIRQVAEACGYADANYFSRTFRKVHGSSPTSFLQGLEKESS